MIRSRPIFAIAVTVLLAPAGSLAGQATVRGTVRLTVEPVMQVSVETGLGGVRAEGPYELAEGVARIRVSANHRWTLVAVEEAVGASSSGPAAEGSASSPVWVRVTSASGRVRPMAESFGNAGQGLAVAEGEPGGDLEVVVDYRWLRGAGDGSTPHVRYVVVPR